MKPHRTWCSLLCNLVVPCCIGVFSGFLRVKCFRSHFTYFTGYCLISTINLIYFSWFKSGISDKGPDFISWSQFSYKNNFWETIVFRKFLLLRILKHLPHSVDLNGWWLVWLMNKILTILQQRVVFQTKVRTSYLGLSFLIKITFGKQLSFESSCYCAS